jgi:hypothetical protein
VIHTAGHKALPPSRRSFAGLEALPQSLVTACFKLTPRCFRIRSSERATSGSRVRVVLIHQDTNI